MARPSQFLNAPVRPSKAELVWLRIDWSGRQPRITRLAASSGSSSASRAPSASKSTQSGRLLLVDVQLASNSINAPDKEGAPRKPNTTAVAPLHAADWSLDIRDKLAKGLASLEAERLRRAADSNLHSPTQADEQTMLARASEWLARWLSVTLESSRDDGFATMTTPTKPAAGEDLLGRPETWMRFLKQNRANLFACLASTTGPLLAHSSAPPVADPATRPVIDALGGSRRRDKLAKIRPAYRSILVRPMGKLVSFR